MSPATFRGRGGSIRYAAWGLDFDIDFVDADETDSPVNHITTTWRGGREPRPTTYMRCPEGDD